MIDQPVTPQLGQNAPLRRLAPLKLGSSKELSIFILLVVLCAFVSIMSHGKFLHSDNLRNTSQQIGLYGIFSVGAGIVIITGGIDLSVGSLLALLGVLLGMMLTTWHWPWPLAVAAVLAGGAVIGSFHGFLITRVGLQPFIVTLCGLLSYRGIARFVSGDTTVGFSSAQGFETLQALATGHVFGVPVPFLILLVVALVMGVVLHKSVFGRYLYAVGRNEEAARYSGVNTRRIIAGAYIISGLLAGLAAILIAFYTNSVQASTHGQSYELYGIAAAVLGGCSLRGGEGSIIGILIGAALLQVLENLVNLLNVPTSLNDAVIGVVILLGVITDQLLKKRNRA